MINVDPNADFDGGEDNAEVPRDVQSGNAEEILGEDPENDNMLDMDKGTEQQRVRTVQSRQEKKEEGSSSSIQLHNQQRTNSARDEGTSQVRQPSVREPGPFMGGNDETKLGGLPQQGKSQEREGRNDPLYERSPAATTEQKDEQTPVQTLHTGTEGSKEKTTQSQTKSLPATIETNENGALVPKNLEELWRLATIYFESKLVPAGLDTKAKVFTALQFAGELGLQAGYVALKNIYIVNGIPHLWGNLPIALVEKSGKLAKKKEWTFNSKIEEICIENKNILDEVAGAACTTWRIKGSEVVESTTWFTVEQAKKAGLWTKNIWKLYPDRMLQCRARAHNLNDNFADVLMGASIMEYQGTGCANDKGELVVESETVQTLSGASRLNALAATGAVK